MMVNLHIKVLIGISLFAKDFQVFEFSKVIPKYCFYILLRDPEDYQDELTQGIIYNSTAKLERLILWLVDNFNIPRSELETFIKSDKAYCIRFLSLRTDKKLEIYMKETEIGILTDEIELAGNIFQDLCVFNNVQNQNTTVNYKEYINELSVLLKRVEKLDSARNQYNINMSEIIGQIKDLYVRAEDSRILEDLNTFRKYFVRINLKNVEILDEFEKRSSTYSSLISDMKKINNIIQLFANLKYGQFNNKVIAQSRQCLKEKKYSLLLKVVKTVE